MNRNTLLITLVILVVVVAGSGIYYVMNNNSNNNQNTTQNTQSNNEVNIQLMAFSPTELKVKKGSTVTWNNKDAFSHIIASDSNTFVSNEITNGAHFSFTFNDAGEFPYHCNIHPTMRAKIIVE